MSEPATANKLFDPAEVRRGLGLLLEPGQVTEVRALDATVNGDRWPGTYTGYFRDSEKLIAALGSIKSATAIYITPNPIEPALINRAHERIKRAGKGDSTSDHNIVRRRWLLIDCDAIRPAGVSATDAEHEAALKRAKQIADDLHFNYGWQEPIVGDSGNGGHLEYLIDEPADDGGLIEGCLHAIAAKHSDAVVKVDTTVHNAARIWKLKGTLACKGDSTDDRPHRMSRIINAPEVLHAVSHEQLEALAAEAEPAKKPPAKTSGNGDALDIIGFIHRNGLEVSGPDPYQGGQKWTFDRSPLCDHHDDGPYLVQFASGALAAGCHHESCNWGWAELRAKFEARRGMPDLRPAEYRDEPENREAREPDTFTFGDLSSTYPTLKPPLIDGLARIGETINIIANPKVGKSWFTYYLALCIITGRPLFGRFATTPSRVMLVDNELHPETLAHRIPLVASAMGIHRDEYADELVVKTLRGNLRSFGDVVCEIHDVVDPSTFGLFAFDAKYRFATPGVSENDNDPEFYNSADRFAADIGAAVAFIHHSSKGSQSDKRTSDVGAGGGVQSRAADVHAIFREHEEEGVHVFEALVRSFAPVEAIPLRWMFPLWIPDDGVDPSMLRGRLKPSEQRQNDRDREAINKIVDAIMKDGPGTARQLRPRTGLSRDRQQRLLDSMAAQGQLQVTQTTIRGNETYEYSLPKTAE